MVAAWVALLGGCGLAGDGSARAASTASASASAPAASAGPSLDALCDAVPPAGAAASAVAEALDAARVAPLYIAATASGAASCRIERDDTAAELTVRARDGTVFLLRRDAAIESSRFETQFVTAPATDLRQLLRRSETHAFGAAGCGVDWDKPEIDGRAIVYRGRACSCQGRIERPAAGRAVRLVFTSTC